MTDPLPDQSMKDRHHSSLVLGAAGFAVGVIAGVVVITSLILADQRRSTALYDYEPIRSGASPYTGGASPYTGNPYTGHPIDGGPPDHRPPAEPLAPRAQDSLPLTEPFNPSKE